MGGINRRDFIKNVAIGSAVLGLGNAVFDKPSIALAGEQHDKEENMSNEKEPEIIASCHCKKVVLKLMGLDPRFTVCHCDTCQLIHNGPWYGAYCNDIKIMDGKDYLSEFPAEHGKGDRSSNLPKGRALWHFCSNCGSRLYYRFNDKMVKNDNERFSISIGLLHHICEEDLIMENEVFFDTKPDYYSFHETKKFSSDEILKKL